jgi:predicted kinase
VVVISVSGVQGTGKTTLARALARRLDATLLSRRPLLETLAAAVPLDALVDARLERIGGLAYAQMTALLQEQLEFGLSVVIECGVGHQLREEWRRITHSAGATSLIIDTICSNVEVHRQRFEARGPTWRGEIGQTWNALDKARTDFRPLPEALLVADSVRSVQENVESIVALIGDLH